MKKKLLFAMLGVLIILSGCIRGPGPEKEWGENPFYNDEQEKDGEFRLPELDLSKQIEPPVSGESKTVNIENIEISYYSTIASYPSLSLGGDVIFRLKNLGDTEKTVYLGHNGEAPPENLHFFQFQEDSIKIESGEEKDVKYFLSLDSKSEFTIDFTFSLEDESTEIEAPIKFYSGSMDESKLQGTSIVYGYVKEKNTNKPIEGAEIRINLYNGREVYIGKSDNRGIYLIELPAVEDIKSFFGGQEFAYDSLDYFMTVEFEDYEYYYEDSISPGRGDKLEKNVYLEKKEQIISYKKIWEKSVSEPYGFFWVMPNSNWTKVLATQAKHNPEMHKPTNQYMYDIETGDKLWSFATEDECWGADISSDGSLVTIGCHDGSLYAINTNDGNQKWKIDCPSMNRESEISHDKTMVLTGPIESYNIALLDANKGTLIKGFDSVDQWLRASAFSIDDSKVATGLSDGYVMMYDITSGNKLWENRMGEFPLFFAMDNKNNVYGSGKGRVIVSYDETGKERWGFRVPDHTVTAGAITPDGSKVVIGTVGGWVYLINGQTGDIVWRRKISGFNVGHNAVAISEDGKTIAIGSAPDYTLFVYDEKGNLILDYEHEENSDPVLDEKFSGIGPNASEGSQKGIMGTAVSPDGTKIIAAYGDDFIIAFEKEMKINND